MHVALGIAAGVVFIVLVLAWLKPSEFRFDRSITVHARPDKVFPLINDFRRWPQWSPWETVDPGMTRTYRGPDAGVGATYTWSGNKKAGSGSMEITSSIVPRQVVIKLDFIAPFEAHNMVDFTLGDAGNATNVTWAMYGPRPFMIKVMDVFTSMDDMVGKDFDRGLANLKKAAES